MLRFTFIYVAMLLSSSLLHSQSAIKNWVANYYSSVRTLGDASVEDQYRISLKSDIISNYFSYESSLIFNDLRPNGQELISAREYFENLRLDFPDGFEIEEEIINDISFNKDGDLAIVVKQEIKNLKSGNVVGGNYQIVVAITFLTHDEFKGYIKSIFPYVPVIDEKTEREKQKEAAAVEAQIWAYTQKVDNKEGYEAYILDYSQSKFVEQAKKRVEELLVVIDEKTEREKQKEAAAMEEKIWAYTQKVDNKKSYEEYILDYPQSKFVEQAKKRGEELLAVNDEKTEREKQNEAVAVEEQIWAYTLNADDKEVYEKYVLDYPQSKFQGQAKKRIEELRVYEKQKELAQDSLIEAAKRKAVLDQQKKYEQDSLELKKLEALAEIENVKVSGKRIERELLLKRLEDNMVGIEGGSFLLGCESSDCDRDEGPMVSKTVESFYIARYEVTIDEWKMIVGDLPIGMERSRNEGEECGDCPITMISYHDAITFIRNLNKMTGKTYRLPYEHEWEYAAMGGKKNKFSGSDNALEVAEYRVNNGIKPVSVLSTKENNFSLCGMSGNVAEWCQDWYAKDSYTRTNVLTGIKQKVIRGGSWNDRENDVRVKSRGKAFPEKRRPTLGFRLVRDIE